MLFKINSGCGSYSTYFVVIAERVPNDVDANESHKPQLFS